MERYNHLNTYLKSKFGERVLKICVDGGFSCPNRDGTKSTSGCIFCSGLGSGEHLASFKSIPEQVNYWINYKKSRADKFIVYFQSFSGTYGSLELLKQKYDSAISTSDKIVGLDIATRPDCITNKVCDMLKKFNKRLPVCVELGLQTANNKSGEIINRCYSTQDFENAVTLLVKGGIEVVAHIMVGLPEESHCDIVQTIKFLNLLPISGIKIHSTYVLKGTTLENLYNNGLYTPITKEEYLNELEYIITHLRPDIIIHRLTGDPPKNLLIAPKWCSNKKTILNGIEKILKEKELYQGIFYKK